MGKSYSSLALLNAARARVCKNNQSKRSFFQLEVVMKQIFLRSLTIVALALSLTLPALADTVRLKDGSVIRGQIVSFKNEQFTILVGSGARGRKSRITVYMEDGDSIGFDSAGSAGNTSGSGEDNTSNTSSQPTYQPPPANTQPTNTHPPK